MQGRSLRGNENYTHHLWNIFKRLSLFSVTSPRDPLATSSVLAPHTSPSNAMPCLSYCFPILDVSHAHDATFSRSVPLIRSALRDIPVFLTGALHVDIPRRRAFASLQAKTNPRQLSAAVPEELGEDGGRGGESTRVAFKIKQIGLVVRVVPLKKDVAAAA